MKQTSRRITQERPTPLERRLAERLRHAPLGQCLTFEEFMALAQQGRRAKGYHQHMQHLVSCPACRRAYLELRALLGVQRFRLARWFKSLSMPPFFQWALASGVAASVFAFALWTFYPRSTGSHLISKEPNTPSRRELARNTETPSPEVRAPETPRQSNERAPSPSPTPDRGAQQSGSRPENRESLPRTAPKASQPKHAPRSGSSGTTQLARSPTEGKPQPPSVETPATDGSAESQQVANAPNITPLERELASVGGQVRLGVDALRNILGTLTGQVRSTPKTPSFGQLRLKQPPINESKPVNGNATPQFLLEESKPTFAWMPVDDATMYRVILKDVRASEPIDVQELAPEQTEYRVALSLDPDKTYELTIEAIRGRANTLRGTLRFTVMSEAQRQDLKLARQKMQTAPLVSGALLYELQRYKEALEAFEVAQRRYPEDEQLRRAVERLRALASR